MEDWKDDAKAIVRDNGKEDKAGEKIDYARNVQEKVVERLRE